MGLPNKDRPSERARIFAPARIKTCPSVRAFSRLLGSKRVRAGAHFRACSDQNVSEPARSSRHCFCWCWLWQRRRFNHNKLSARVRGVEDAPIIAVLSLWVAAVL